MSASCTTSSAAEWSCVSWNARRSSRSPESVTSASSASSGCMTLLLRRCGGRSPALQSGSPSAPRVVVVRAIPQHCAGHSAGGDGRAGRTLGAMSIQGLLDRAADGGRITPDEALLLYTDAPLHALGQAADTVRRRRYPDNIATYIIDRNINYTNVCLTACKFCAFYRAPKHEEGWTHTDDEILRRCGEAVDLGATQIMLQGGHSPDLGIEWYERIFSAIKQQYPQLT